MSKHINVNPNFYKVGGREHAEGHGEAITHETDKQQLTQNGKRGAKNRKVLPGHKNDRG
jgi:hypothetical protein